MLPDLLAFASDLLASRGALVEYEAANILAVLPTDVSAQLHLPESCRLSVGGSPTNGAPGDDSATSLPCGFGTPTLERLLEVARERIPVACARLEVDAPRLSQGRALGERFAPRNGLSRFIDTGPCEAEYLFAAFAWAAEADDRYEGLFSLVLATQDAAEPDVAFSSQIDPTASARLQPLAGAPAPLDAERLSRPLVRRVDSALAGALAPALASVRRRHARDHERISEYFASMIAETAAPKRRIDPETIRGKIERLALERDTKLRDLPGRFALRVSAQPVAFLRVTVPSVAVRVSILRRKRSGELLLRLPALAQVLDRVACDGCGSPAGRISLCDDQLHRLCERCAPSAQGRVACPACSGGGS